MMKPLNHSVNSVSLLDSVAYPVLLIPQILRNTSLHPSNGNWALTLSHFLFFFFFLFFQFYFIFKLYIIVLVLPNIKMNPPQVYMCSSSRTLLPPPSPCQPSGPSSAPAPSIQHRASNLDWQLVSYMIFYMFHCQDAQHHSLSEKCKSKPL